MSDNKNEQPDLEKLGEVINKRRKNKGVMLISTDALHFLNLLTDGKAAEKMAALPQEEIPTQIDVMSSEQWQKHIKESMDAQLHDEFIQSWSEKSGIAFPRTVREHKLLCLEWSKDKDGIVDLQKAREMADFLYPDIKPTEPVDEKWMRKSSIF